jgi:hypothetical protein
MYRVALAADRVVASELGRPCALHEDESVTQLYCFCLSTDDISYDVSYPMDCDDECWITADSQEAFIQPEGKLSSLSYFICSLKLQHVHSFALHTLVSPELYQLFDSYKLDLCLVLGQGFERFGIKIVSVRRTTTRS